MRTRRYPSCTAINCTCISSKIIAIASVIVYYLYLGFISFESDLVFSVTAVMSQPVLWLILGVAVLGTLSYLNFYRAIDTIGPVKATALNISYAIWAIVFSILLGGAEFNPILLLSAALMIVSSVLVSQHEGA